MYVQKYMYPSTPTPPQKSEEEVPPDDIIPQDAPSQGGGVFWAGP